jgi:hypothetical protein
MSSDRFRLFTAAALPLAERWLHTPQSAWWWGDPPRQIDLPGEDLDEPLMRQWNIEQAGLAFAPVHAYDTHVWLQSHPAPPAEGARPVLRPCRIHR